MVGTADTHDVGCWSPFVDVFLRACTPDSHDAGRWSPFAAVFPTDAHDARRWTRLRQHFLPAMTADDHDASCWSPFAAVGQLMLRIPFPSHFGMSNCMGSWYAVFRVKRRRTHHMFRLGMFAANLFRTTCARLPKLVAHPAASMKYVTFALACFSSIL